MKYVVEVTRDGRSSIAHIVTKTFEGKWLVKRGGVVVVVIFGGFYSRRIFQDFRSQRPTQPNACDSKKERRKPKEKICHSSATLEEVALAREWYSHEGTCARQISVKVLVFFERKAGARFCCAVFLGASDSHQVMLRLSRGRFGPVE